MDGFTLVGSGGAPAVCPVCGLGQEGCCAVNAAGNVICMGRSVPKPGYRLVGDGNDVANGHGTGTLYTPIKEGSLRPDGKLIERENPAVENAQKIKDALAIWDQAKGALGHEHVLRYLAGRGIDVANAAVLDAAKRIGYIAKHKLTRSGVDLTGPVLVAPATSPDGAVVGVQRILLDHEGVGLKRKQPKDWPDEDRDGQPNRWEVKIARGPINTMGSIMLGDPSNGVLVLCEGIETAFAIVQATGLTVWACVSTSGLLNAVVPPGVNAVVIAADNDTKKPGVPGPGEKVAVQAAARLIERTPGLNVSIAMPGPDVGGELFNSDAVPIKKGLDWLDVLTACGPEPVARAMQGHICAVDPKPKEAPADFIDDNDGVNIRELLGGNGRIIPAGGEVGMSRFLLLDCPALRLSKLNGQRWPLVRHAEGWYLWVDGGGKKPTMYRELHPDALYAMVGRTMQGWRRVNAGVVRPMNPPTKSINNTITNMKIDTLVPDGDLPKWVPATFDDDGKPIWDGLVAGSPGDGMLEPKSIFALPDGLLDLRAWEAGKVVMHKHTPRWFSLGCSPVIAPWPQINKLLKSLEGAEAEQQILELEKMAAGLAPQWAGFLSKSLPDRADRRVLQMFYGYCCTSDMSQEKFLVFIGPSGSGKSTAMEPLAVILGDSSVQPMSMTDLQNDFALHEIIGKSVVVMPDEAKGNTADMARIMSQIAKWVGRDPMNGDRKYKSRIGFKPTAKLVVSFNELPTMPDAAGKLERRMLLLPFTQAVTEENRRKDLKDQWASEAAGILLWALCGLRRLRMQGGFTMSEAAMLRLSDYREQNAPPLEFVRDYCLVLADERQAAKARGEVWRAEMGDRFRVIKSDLHLAFNEWAQRQDRHTLPASTFYERLQAAVPGLEEERPRVGVGKKRERVWVGICLNKDGEALLRGDDVKARVAGNYDATPAWMG